MINKILKNIHSSYLIFLKFFFFLKYLIVIFFGAILLFLLIPKLFNYEGKLRDINTNLIKNYNLELEDYKLIKYKIFPLPHLLIKKSELNIKKETKIMSDEMSIFLSFQSIYNLENMKITKISFNNSLTNLEINKVLNFAFSLNDSKNKIYFKNLNLILRNNEKVIANLKEISFANYGNKINQVFGKVFDKKFKLSFDENKLSFKILNSGINVIVNLEDKFEKNNFAGSSNINILDYLLKLNFVADKNRIELKKSKLRNKNLSFSFNSLIQMEPFFEINSNFIINKINKDLLYNLDLENILKNKKIIKKLNGKNTLVLEQQRSFNRLINSLSADIDFTNGRVHFSNEIILNASKIICNGNSLLIEEYPRLNFNCFFYIDDKKIFLKQFAVKKNQYDKKPLNIEAVGSINIFNRKINLEKLKIGDTKPMATEEIQYYKETFERVLFDENFIKIFKKDKIKSFITAVI